MDYQQEKTLSDWCDTCKHISKKAKCQECIYQTVKTQRLETTIKTTIPCYHETTEEVAESGSTH